MTEQSWSVGHHARYAPTHEDRIVAGWATVVVIVFAVFVGMLLGWAVWA